MASILAFPGIDPAMAGAGPAPDGRSIVIRGSRGAFRLEALPGGPVAHPRLATITAARSYASRLCRRFPLTYWRIFDETDDGELVSDAPFNGGDAA